MARGLLAIIAGAGKAGIKIRGDAVKDHQHHLYIIADADSAEVIKKHFAPFGQVGTLTVTPASHCEEVVARGDC